MINRKPAVYEIQTTNRCNGRCLVCPHGNVEQTYQTMDADLFQKLIEEIATGEDVVRIVLYLNGEPFLDEYFGDRLRYVRQKCPNAIIEVSTNLSVFREDIFGAIRKCDIDDFRISCFGFFKDTYEKIMPGLKYDSFIANIKYLIDFRNNYDRLRNVSLTMLDIPELQDGECEQARKFCEDNHMSFNFWGYLDRAGNVKRQLNHVMITEDDERKKIYTCAQSRHVERMHILVDGTVILCCQDWRREYVLGSVTKNTLQEIWESEEYERIRKQIDQIGYPYPLICKRCKILLEGRKE